MKSMKRGLYVAGAIGLGALLGAGCVPFDPKGPMKDKLPMYKMDGNKFQDYMKGFKEIEGPVKGLKGIESYIQGPEKTLDFDPFDNPGDKDKKTLDFNPFDNPGDKDKQNLDFDPFDNTGEKDKTDNQPHPWRR